ncbi:protein zinc induced facilitator-like 1 [Galdieria sulphuraria]|nr:protein zinc induced facilitator-like 1 [Galdieria sulphuraria]
MKKSSVLPPRYPSPEATTTPAEKPTLSLELPKPTTTPLPTLRLVILGLAVLADAFSVTIVYPFAPFLATIQV